MCLFNCLIMELVGFGQFLASVGCGDGAFGDNLWDLTPTFRYFSSC